MPGTIHLFRGLGPKFAKGSAGYLTDLSEFLASGVIHGAMHPHPRGRSYSLSMIESILLLFGIVKREKRNSLKKFGRVEGREVGELGSWLKTNN